MRVGGIMNRKTTHTLFGLEKEDIETVTNRNCLKASQLSTNCRELKRVPLCRDMVLTGFAKNHRFERKGLLAAGQTGPFSRALMNDAVYTFRGCEDASLIYVGINKHEGEDI